jgi:membrane fusion protein, multidrug efflux system
MLLTRLSPAVFVVGLLMLGCNRQKAAPQPPPPAVTVAHPLDREVMEWDEYPGRLEAVHTVHVRAQVGGYMQSVHFREGGLVKKGDLLFAIDPRPFEAEVSRTQGELNRAKAHLVLAETEFKRVKGLVPTEAASELELDEKRANLDEAKAAVEVAEANLQTARINLGYTQLKAEISGRISKAEIKPGNLVAGGPNQATLLTTITSLDPIYCYVDADERSVLKYQRLAREKKRISARDAEIPCRLALLNEDKFEHIGLVDFVNNRVDPTTGTLQARGVFPNPGGAMTPGMFGRLRVPGAAPYRTLLVSEQAIQSDQSRKYVLTVDGQNVVHKTYVTVGIAFGGLRAIEEGLTAYDLVIVNGILRARPATKVDAKPGPMPAAEDVELYATTRVSVPTTAPTTKPSAFSPSPGTPGEGRGEGLSLRNTEDPHPNPLPDYREREFIGGRAIIAPMVGVAQEVVR